LARSDRLRRRSRKIPGRSLPGPPRPVGAGRLLPLAKQGRLVKYGCRPQLASLRVWTCRRPPCTGSGFYCSSPRYRRAAPYVRPAQRGRQECPRHRPLGSTTRTLTSTSPSTGGVAPSAAVDAVANDIPTGETAAMLQAIGLWIDAHLVFRPDLSSNPYHWRDFDRILSDGYLLWLRRTLSSLAKLRARRASPWCSSRLSTRTSCAK
jgi:hypothetical protein